MARTRNSKERRTSCSSRPRPFCRSSTRAAASGARHNKAMTHIQNALGELNTALRSNEILGADWRRQRRPFARTASSFRGGLIEACPFLAPGTCPPGARVTGESSGVLGSFSKPVKQVVNADHGGPLFDRHGEVRSSPSTVRRAGATRGGPPAHRGAFAVGERWSGQARRRPQAGPSSSGRRARRRSAHSDFQSVRT